MSTPGAIPPIGPQPTNPIKEAMRWGLEGRVPLSLRLGSDGVEQANMGAAGFEPATSRV
jgi:hypothetical protein